MSKPVVIEFIGGPMDGVQEQFAELPADGTEICRNCHSYTFNFTEWQFDYRGRWRHIEIGPSLLTYRTFAEALRQLGQLQFVGAITAAESLEFQARIKEGLNSHANKL